MPVELEIHLKSYRSITWNTTAALQSQSEQSTAQLGTAWEWPSVHDGTRPGLSPSMAYVCMDLAVLSHNSSSRRKINCHQSQIWTTMLCTLSYLLVTARREESEVKPLYVICPWYCAIADSLSDSSSTNVIYGHHLSEACWIILLATWLEVAVIDVIHQ